LRIAELWELLGEKSSSIVEPTPESTLDLIRPFKTRRWTINRNDLLEGGARIRGRLIVGTIDQIPQPSKDARDASS
jgi:hypothetical protein